MLFLVFSALLVILFSFCSYLAIFAYICPDSYSAYECGFEPKGSSHHSFCIKFFLVAIIYLVFDVEVGFLIPSLYTSGLTFTFLIILLLGLYYEFMYGGLD